ncbi:hypothetical protein L226DRAFT_613986 [Lentinus tigrinus ALCF2SS1-7]|uniref:uncharacterized protein n=1 Tax=Lentinus tigrinus ALCF2SS1-7 TaxID=1328758 RepID=UPI0011663CFF|nr:hypothetical protein L226DRAFT_613986 [Lentinus tigrinus ALCF2SS1-7]
MLSMEEGKVGGSAAKGRKPLWQGRNVGKLRQMLNVPMDVFFEIISHLEPKDILQLSRVSKELRSMLRSPTSRHVWVTARKNVEPALPEPPEDMSEPLYAFLVFERFCQGCGHGRAQNADYALRVRLCGNCWRTDTAKGKDICRFLGLSKKDSKDVAEVLYTLTPKGTRSWSDGGWDMPLLTLDQSAKHSYYTPQFMPVAKQYLAMCKPSGDPTALMRFVEERQAETLARRNFHMDMLRWENARNNAQYHAGADAQAERIADIHNNLSELGYEESEFPRYNQDWDQMLRQPRKLTPRIWNTIRPKLLAILDEQRGLREAEAFRLKWIKRREHLQMHYKKFLQQDRTSVEIRTLPSPADAVELPCMKELVTAEDPDVDLTEAQFLAVRATMLDEAREYGARVKHELAKKLIAVHKPKPISPSRAPPRKRRSVAGASSLAKSKQVEASDTELDSEEEHELLEDVNSVFRCSSIRYRPVTNCSFYMSYLGLLEHRQSDHDTWRVQDVYVSKPGSGCLDLDAGFSKRLLSALGLGNDATHTEIDELLHSGRPKCSCGKLLIPNIEAEATMLGRLINHLALPSRWLQTNNSQTASTGSGGEHRITFERCAFVDTAAAASSG